MCGLFGVYSFERTSAPDAELLRRSIDSLGHRGPDSHGAHTAAGIALGHTRLSFLDLSPEGNQPLWDRDHRYCIVYNGEIYNFKELRADLIQQGYSFRTGSDTEVLLYGMIAQGPEFLRKADGMFAFALYDSQEHSILLGRDRFGIKPLYVAHDGQRLVFSSELRAMRGWCRIGPNEKLLAAYVTGFDLPTSGETLLDGIDFFPTGSAALLTPTQRSLQPKPFFALNEFWHAQTASELARLSTAQLVDRFDELLTESVRLHMIADVPVGALCSGGVDSSIILALAARHSSSLAIFHADVVGPHSELPAAKALARHLRLQLNVVQVRDGDFIDLMPEVLTSFEFPFLYHPNSIPFLQVTRLVQNHSVKAVLTGEGSDEILLGYSDIPLRKAIARYHGTVDHLRRLVHRLPWIGQILWRTPAGSMPSTGKQLLTAFEEVQTPRLDSLSASDSERALHGIAYRLLGYHLRTLLMRNDRLGMAASIEARFPFLEHGLVGLAVNLPNRTKIRPSLSAADEIRHPFLSTKWILRQVASRYLPRELAFRAKRGFPTNAFDRLRVDATYFENSWVADHYRLERTALAHLQGAASNAELLRFLMLDAWGRLIVEAEQASSVRARLQRSLSFA